MDILTSQCPLVEMLHFRGRVGALEKTTRPEELIKSFMLTLANGFFLAPLAPSVGRRTSCPLTSSTSKAGMAAAPFPAAFSGLSRMGSFGGSVALFCACAVLACCWRQESVRFRSSQ